MNIEDINAKLERAEAFRMREKLGLPPVPASLPQEAAGGQPAPLVPAVPNMAACAAAAVAAVADAGQGQALAAA